MRLDLEALGLEEGADILVRRALRKLAPGERLEVSGTHGELRLQLRAWARGAGVAVEFDGLRPEVAWLSPGAADFPTERAGAAALDGVVAAPPRYWGLAARGAAVEFGSPEFDFGLVDKQEVWSEDASRLYARAAAAQWDPETAIDWRQPILHDDDIETAIVQVMTYLIENETAALLVPARFVSQIHPHFREVLQVLAIQAADEARHIEVFTRRALLRHAAPGLSTSGGQASLKTLVTEPDFAIASFLLSVMGEGSFLVLLDFLAREGPDAITRDICRLAAQDEARHVAFGLAHLRRHAAEDTTLRPRLAMAMQRRHAELAQTSGLNALVFEALTLIAAGGYEPARIASGHARIMRLQAEMDSSRRGSLIRLGFDAEEAAALSGLHTRNFM